MEKICRNSNHELLRIIAIYMIVFIHANMYLNDFCVGSVNTFFNGMVNGICNIGVTCFILISGYYGVKFSIRKFIKMECMMITFSVLETAVLCIMLPEQMKGAELLEQVVKSFLPFITRKYWFYSCYVCLLFLSSYIHRFIESLSRKEYRRLLFILLFLFSILPTVFYFELIPDNGKGLVQMIMVYMIGRYIRMYRAESINDLIGRKKAIGLFMVLWVVNGISHEFPLQIGAINHHLCKDNSITNLVMAVILFYVFKDLKLRSKMINNAAAYVFAVFALNNSLVEAVMKTLSEYAVLHRPVENTGIIINVLGFLILAGIVLLVLLVCLIAGFIREKVFGRIDQKLEEIMERLFCRVSGE